MDDSQQNGFWIETKNRNKNTRIIFIFYATVVITCCSMQTNCGSYSRRDSPKEFVVRFRPIYWHFTNASWNELKSSIQVAISIHQHQYKCICICFCVRVYFENENTDDIRRCSEYIVLFSHKHNLTDTLAVADRLFTIPSFLHPSSCCFSTVTKGMWCVRSLSRRMFVYVPILCVFVCSICILKCSHRW